MKTKLLNKSYLLVSLALLGCGGADYNATFSTEEGIASLKEKIEDTFFEDKPITSLSIAMQTFDNDIIEQITIFFPENDKNTMWFYSYATGQLYKPETKETLKSNPKTQKISAFSLDECYPNFKKAIALIENETDEFTNYRINSYDMTVNQTSGKIEHNFIVFADKKSMKPTFYGKKIGDKLYRFSFNYNAEGTLMPTEGLDTFE